MLNKIFLLSLILVRIYSNVYSVTPGFDQISL